MADSHVAVIDIFEFGSFKRTGSTTNFRLDSYLVFLVFKYPILASYYSAGRNSYVDGLHQLVLNQQ